MSGCGAVISHRSSSRNTFETPLTGSRSVACEHRPGWTNSPSVRIRYAHNMTPKEGDLPFLTLKFPKTSHQSFFLILNINTTFWSSPGTDYWLHFTIEKVWGVKGFLEVLESLALKLDGGWVCRLRIGCPHLLGCSVANKASRVCEGSGWIVIIPHSWFVVDDWSYRRCLHVINIKPEDST